MPKCQKKRLKLFLKKFPLYSVRNNVESETVLYLTNGRNRRPIRSSIDVSFSSPTTVDIEPLSHFSLKALIDLTNGRKEPQCITSLYLTFIIPAKKTRSLTIHLIVSPW